MASNLRKFALVTALAVGATGANLIPAMAQDQDHHDSDRDHARDHDYTSNTFYQTGYREGVEDREHHKKRDRHDHEYRSDDDRRAHDAGYQSGWRGENHEQGRDEDHPH